MTTKVCSWCGEPVAVGYGNPTAPGVCRSCVEETLRPNDPSYTPSALGYVLIVGFVVGLLFLVFLIWRGAASLL